MPSQKVKFTNPPVDELVLGVQFGSIEQLRTIHLRQIWELFGTEFPNVQEMHQLAPRFETFNDADQDPELEIETATLPPLRRLWFSSVDEQHLVQFQHDRLIFNWRRRHDQIVYPSFEVLLTKFEQQFLKLSDFTRRHFNFELEINQTEVAYINIMQSSDFPNVSNFQRVINQESLDIDGLQLLISEVLKDEAERPFARMIYEMQSLVKQEAGTPAHRFGITVRGAPTGAELPNALAFMEMSHSRIISQFLILTTENAQKFWGKAEG